MYISAPTTILMTNPTIRALTFQRAILFFVGRRVIDYDSAHASQCCLMRELANNCLQYFHFESQPQLI